MAEVKVLDCTVRDGGLMNRWRFDDGFVRRLVAATRHSGCGYVEIGYRASAEFFSPAEYGKWRFCTDEVLEEFWSPEAGGAVLTVMVDVGRSNPADLGPADRSLVGAVRVACYAPQIDEAVEATRILADLGYETFVNVMAVSEADPRVLDQALAAVARHSPARAVSVVDSYGNLTPDRTGALVRRYLSALGGKEVGFHGHNN